MGSEPPFGRGSIIALSARKNIINDNLLNEQFNRQSKNEVWVTGTTEVLYGTNPVKKAHVHVVLDLYGRYALGYNISPTETAVSAIEVFERAFKVEPDAHPLIHTDRGSAYCSMVFNNYLTNHNCLHSMSHPGHPWENSPMERWWNDFKLIWLAKRSRPKTLEEIEQSVRTIPLRVDT